MSESNSNSPAPLRRPTTTFATVSSQSAKIHDINYILGPSSDSPAETRPPEEASPVIVAPAPTPPPPPRPEDVSAVAASLLTTFSSQRQVDPDGLPIQYTPTTHRISKAKKGRKVHVCEFGCGKIFTRAEHRKRHEANHRSEPLYNCPVEGCNKPFQRLDLLNRHLERQHGIGPATAESASSEAKGDGNQMLPPQRPHASSATGKNDWNTHRDTIERLYITENKPLKDIKVHMEENYGFTPVEDRAYEKAFRRLGLSKNIPSVTMEAILQEIDRRRNMGKDTLVYWRNQRVDEKRIHRFRQRLARENKVDPAEFFAQGRTFELPEHVRCETPVGTPNNHSSTHPAPDANSPESSDDGVDYSGSDGEGDERPSKRLQQTASDVLQQQAVQQAQLECPAPQCQDRGVRFSSKELLWHHMTAEHQMK